MALDWRTIHVPKQQYDYIQVFIEKYPMLGYVSVPNFISEAIREKILRDTEITNQL